jgi:hypothetical protein
MLGILLLDCQAFVIEAGYIFDLGFYWLFTYLLQKELSMIPFLIFFVF